MFLLVPAYPGCRGSKAVVVVVVSRCRLFACGPADATASIHPLHPSSLASVKSRLVLAFWYLLTQVVLEKRPLIGCGSSSSSCIMEYMCCCAVK